MKVTLDTPDRLLLERRPWLLALGLIVFTLIFAGVGLSTLADGEMLGGLAFLFGGTGMGVLGFWAFVRRTMVIFDRGLGTVTIRRKWMTGYSEEVLALTDIREVIVQTSRGDGDSADTHRPALIVERGAIRETVPLVQVYVSGRGAARIAKAVNAWLEAAGTRVDSQEERV